MSILKLNKNRVWRTYTGGKKIDEFYNNDIKEDGHCPEVWVSSVTEATNPDKIENEGLSFIQSDSENISLKSEIDNNPSYYLGEEHINKHGETLGILVKLLDAAERLTIQVHPSKEKALSLFNSQFGKTEAWLILNCREIDGEKPHIYFGFKKGITEKDWRDVFESQDIPLMLDLMNKVYVEQGDIFLIEGGMPHAIGAGCFILEIQEPTDLTIRTERVTPGGYDIPDMLLHQNLGFEKMFECFNYNGYDIDEMQKWVLTPQKTEDDTVQKIIGYEHTKCFSLEEINTNKESVYKKNNRFSVLICMEGSGIIKNGNETFTINRGDQFFIPAGESEFTLIPNDSDSFKIIRCLPPE